MRLPRGEAPGDEVGVPEAGMLYWVDTTILPPGDPEEQRPVVVLDVPETVDGTVVVVSRSGVDEFGVADVDGDGRFSRRHPVHRRLWTAGHVTPAGPLDAGVWAAVVDRFSAP